MTQWQESACAMFEALRLAGRTERQALMETIATIHEGMLQGIDTGVKRALGNE